MWLQAVGLCFPELGQGALQSPQCLSEYLPAKYHLKTSPSATSPGEPPFILS